MRTNRSFMRRSAEYKHKRKLACSFLDSDQFAVFDSLSDSVMIGIHFNSFRFLIVFRFSHFLKRLDTGTAVFKTRHRRKRYLLLLLQLKKVYICE